jgi:uncharacterized membrane protein
MLNKLKTRLRNPKVITAICSGVLIILVNTGVIDLEMSKKVTETVTILLGIGVSIGVFGDPESHVKE